MVCVIWLENELNGSAFDVTCGLLRILNPLCSQLRCALSGCGPHRWFSGRWASEASPLPPLNSRLLAQDWLGILVHSRPLMLAFGTLQVHSTDAAFALLSDVWPRKPSSAWLLTLCCHHNCPIIHPLFTATCSTKRTSFYLGETMPNMWSVSHECSSWRSLPPFLITSSHNRDTFCINGCSHLLFI